MQNHHSRGSSMGGCTVLLEPTVKFIHLQQCDELLDKFLVGFSIYTGFKKQRSNYSTPRNGTPHTYFFVDAKVFRCNYVGFQFSMFGNFGYLRNH